MYASENMFRILKKEDGSDKFFVLKEIPSFRDKGVDGPSIC